MMNKLKIKHPNTNCTIQSRNYLTWYLLVCFVDRQAAPQEQFQKLKLRPCFLVVISSPLNFDGVTWFSRYQDLAARLGMYRSWNPVRIQCQPRVCVICRDGKKRDIVVVVVGECVRVSLEKDSKSVPASIVHFLLPIKSWWAEPYARPLVEQSWYWSRRLSCVCVCHCDCCCRCRCRRPCSFSFWNQND